MTRNWCGSVKIEMIQCWVIISVNDCTQLLLRLTMNSDSQYTDPFEHLVRLTMKLLEEHEYKKQRFQVLCCIYTSTEGKPLDEMKLDDVIKHTHLKNLSERKILNAIDFLKEKYFIVCDHDNEPGPSSGIVWVTYAGIKELDLNIDGMIAMIEDKN